LASASSLSYEVNLEDQAVRVRRLRAFPAYSRTSRLCFQPMRARGIRNGERDENHERISVPGVRALSQQLRTSFNYYESAWRTSNPVGATTNRSHDKRRELALFTSLLLAHKSPENTTRVAMKVAITLGLAHPCLDKCRSTRRSVLGRGRLAVNSQGHRSRPCGGEEVPETRCCSGRVRRGGASSLVQTISPPSTA